MPPQSPPPVQNHNQTPPTPAESLADQQMKLIKARGINYFNTSVSMWVNQLYNKPTRQAFQAPNLVQDGSEWVLAAPGRLGEYLRPHLAVNQQEL